jgi:hypothetical protein
MCDADIRRPSHQRQPRPGRTDGDGMDRDRCGTGFLSRRGLAHERSCTSVGFQTIAAMRRRRDDAIDPEPTKLPNGITCRLGATSLAISECEISS